MSEREMDTIDFIGLVQVKKKDIALVFDMTKDQRIAAGIIAILGSADDPLAVLEATRLAFKKMTGYEINY